ncbi:MAG: efflux RND transporter permease subunit [Spirochaetes bacterium]|nr:efflux RND transporter permease subunit [Spirochaetota bacterium]
MNKIISFFIKKPLLINFILLFIIIAGIFSIGRIKKDIFPLSDIDTVVIEVQYPGASPADVELNAIIPIERKLATIRGIQNYTSYAIENGGTVFAYIDPDSSNKTAIKDEIFRTITTSNVDDLSTDVEKIQIVDINPKLMAVLNIAIIPKTENLPEKELYNIADQLEKKLIKLPGVAEIRKSGYKDREIHISVNPDKSESNFITLDEIIKSIQNRNIRATGGTIQSVLKEENIVTIGQFQNYKDVGDVIIRSNFIGNSIKVNDIAEVSDTFKVSSTRFRVNGKEAVGLSVVKKESADVIDTIKNVKKYLSLNADEFSKNTDIKVIDDKSQSIDSLLGVVISNAVIGFALVFLILILFFDLRTSFWTAFGIPVTLLMVAVFMYTTDQTIDMISLGAIITVLGMLVDHGIVISEVVYKTRESGGSDNESIVNSVISILSPVTITILTTIAAFLPMFAIKGMMGKFIYIFPVIITASLIASFFEATFILPSHLAHIKKPPKQKKWFNVIIVLYEKLLKITLKFRYIAVGAFVIIFLLTLFISRATIQNYVLLWDDSADAIYINLEAEDGTPLDQTEKQTLTLLPLINEIIRPEEMIAVSTNIGHHTVKRMSSKGNRENWSQYLIYLVPKSERKRNASQIINALREKINPKTVNSFKKIMFSERVIGPSVGDAFDLKIIASENPENAKKLLQEVVTFTKSIDGVKDVSTDQQKGKNEIYINFNFKKLASYGMDVAAVSRTVKTAYDGLIVTSVQTPKTRLDFRLKMDDRYKRDIKFLSELLIPNGQGAMVKLGEIASFSTKSGQAVINHYNGEKILTINAGVDSRKLTSSKLTAIVKKQFINYKDQYPGTELLFGGEAQETKATMGDLSLAFLIAILFIYFLLFMLFNSPSLPFVVLLSIPFGITGALAAFTFHGIPLSFMGIIGIIGLSGVVVNDSVVMVDFINKLSIENKGKNTNFISDVITGAKQRLRPVILTTATTVAGLLPTVYGIGGDAKTLVPVVMAMAYGLLFATLITLILIPSLYVINSDIKLLFQKKARD